MTAKERVYEVVRDSKKVDMDKDSVDKLIMIAYFMGREKAAKEICDEAREIFREQRKRAEECRYYNMAMKVQGSNYRIYSSDYSGDFTNTFGNDVTEL